MPDQTQDSGNTDTSDLSLNPDHVQELYDQGMIDDDTYNQYMNHPTQTDSNSMEQGVTYREPTTQVTGQQGLFPDLPQGSPVIAGPELAPFLYGGQVVGQAVNTINGLGNASNTNESSLPLINPQQLNNAQGNLNYTNGLGGDYGDLKSQANQAAENIKNIVSPTQEAGKEESYNTDSRTPGQVQVAKAVQMQTIQAGQIAQDFLNDKQSRYNQILDQSRYIDPNRYNKELGISGNLVNTLGLILGGFGAGITGGPNYAAEIYKTKLQQDIQAQEQDYHIRLQTLAGANNLALNETQVANLRALTNSTATNDILHGLQAHSGFALGQATAVNAPNNIAKFMQDNGIALSNAQANLINVTKGITQSGDVTSLGMMALAAGVKPGKYTNPNVIIPNKSNKYNNNPQLNQNNDQFQTEDSNHWYSPITNFFNSGSSPTGTDKATKSKEPKFTPGGGGLPGTYE